MHLPLFSCSYNGEPSAQEILPLVSRASIFPFERTLIEGIAHIFIKQSLFQHGCLVSTMVYCRSTCPNYPWPLVSLATRYDIEATHFFFTFHSKAFGDRRPFEGCLDTWRRLCHYRNGQQASSCHIYIYDGLRLSCLVSDRFQAPLSFYWSFEAC